MSDTAPLAAKALPFGILSAATVESCVSDGLDRHREVIGQILQIAAPTFENAILLKEQADSELAILLGATAHLAAVCDTAAYREAYQRLQPQISRYFAGLGQNRELLAVFTSIQESDDTLDDDERRLIDLAIRDFHLSGVALADAPRARFVEIATELSEIENAFANALLDATQEWARPLSDGELAGISERGRMILAENARMRDMDGYVATLDQPSVQAVLAFAEDRALRREVYHAQATRASEVGPDAGRFDNGPRITEILSLRREVAELLGFDDFVASSLATKMATDGAEVREFLNDLIEKVRPVAKRELSELRDFAREMLGIDGLEPWDLAFASERMRQAIHAIDEEEIARYLPLDAVLAGLFAHVRNLFGVELVEEAAGQTWHPDVRYLTARLDGKVVAGLYLDLHARAGKQGGAWMSDGRHRVRGIAADPIAYLTCNFAPRSASAPTLLRHDDVVTLFHEMGHCLHHLLSEVDLPSIGGITGVEWDAVELPSQFHESFAWDEHVLARISAHVETGAPMPPELIRRMIGARDFHAGLGMVTQLERSLFDVEVHALANPKIEEVDRVVQEVRDRCAVVPVPDWHRYSRSFAHIFAGGYAAGYYSYLWAERLSADAYEAFQATGSDHARLGSDFRREILSRGASRPAIDSFVAFRGRMPDNDALLRQRGLAA